MSALSIFKPAKPLDQPAPLSVEALLGAATKKSAKSNNHLIYNGADTQAAAKWLALGRQAEEIERELALLRDTILGVIIPWHEEACARRRAPRIVRGNHHPCWDGSRLLAAPLHQAAA
ncbi:MAG TPA: hypothetical protein VE988_04150 [Gemmataceae bacterium]|nr:hypothetical protein [Gemmataceae bacterium]